MKNYLLLFCFLLISLLGCYSYVEIQEQLDINTLRIQEIEMHLLTDNQKLNHELKELADELVYVKNELKILKENHFIASAYTSKDDGCNNITATGTIVAEGRTIAVDPSIIPLGSEVIIESDYPGISGKYIAEDVGGDIKGNRIDIYMEDVSRALNFGRREIKVIK